eukprot:jgi/Picsp_1/5751/NSC_03110-R1_interferon-related developmental regulator family protein
MAKKKKGRQVEGSSQRSTECTELDSASGLGMQNSDSEDEGIMEDIFSLLTDKGKKSRISGLNRLRSILLVEWIGSEELQSHMDSLSGPVLNCLKRGKPEERNLSAAVLGAFFFSLGYFDSSDPTFQRMKLISLRILSENTRDDYSLMIQSLGVVFSIVGDAGEISDLLSLLLELAEQGSNSDVQCCLLRTWSFLFSFLPATELVDCELIEHSLLRLSEFLDNSDINVRSPAGQAIALVYDTYNLTSSSKIHEESFEDGFQSMSNLMGARPEEIISRMKKIQRNWDDPLRKSKQDRSQQRGDFREYLKVIEGGSIKEQKISLTCGTKFTIDTFRGIIMVNYLRDFLGEGFQTHIQHNTVMHQLFHFEPAQFQLKKDDLTDKAERSRLRKEERKLSLAYKNSMLL